MSAHDDAHGRALLIGHQRAFIDQLSRDPAMVDGDLAVLAPVITEACSQLLDVDRVGVWFFTDSETELHCIDQYNRQDSAHTSGAILREPEFLPEFHALKTSLYVDASDPYHDPRTAGYIEGYLRPHRISAMLDVVIRFGGKNLGLLCFEHVDQPHVWRADEIDFGCQVGMQLWVLLERLVLRHTEEAWRRTEARLRETEAASERRTRFVADAGHDLGTPLTIMLGHCERLLADGGLDASQRQHLESILHQARTLHVGLGDLIDLGRLEAGRMTAEFAETDLAELVRQVAAPFEVLAADRQMAFTVETPAPVRIPVDADKVRRVLTNLLANAFKFTQRGGSIRCHLATSPQGAAVTVSDNGPGIPPAYRSAVLERFVRADAAAIRRQTGSGLGLAIARDLTEMHGGTLTIGDNPGARGTAVTMSLPWHPPAGKRRPSELPASSAPAGAHAAATPVGDGESADRPLILIVDDDPDMHALVGDILGGAYRLIDAYDGREGLAKATAFRPDLVISDLKMPVMDGEALLQALKASPELEALPVLLLTARDDEATRVALLRTGAQDYLVKPFVAAEFRARVGNLVAVKRARDVLQHSLDSQQLDVERLALELARRNRDLQAAHDAMQVARDQAERASHLKTTFLRLVSHELRTPLTTMHLHLRLLGQGDDTPLSPKRQASVQAMAEAGKRLLDLVDGLLEYARIEAGSLPVSLATVDLALLAREVAESVQPEADAKGLTLWVDLPEALPAVASDARLLRLILRHLLGNAVKFTDAGQVGLGLTVAAGEVRLTVRDTGPGIAAERRHTIFEPFVEGTPIQHKHKPGIGLGLALVKEMVEALGGRILVESTLGAGSTFTVILPSGGAP